MMNKSRVKQLYLLIVIISGIITLSVYSTYSIFTLENSTSNIVSIHTPNTLKIDAKVTEYKQVTIPKNSYISTDIDIYNNYDYNLCYSVWYNVIANSNVDINKVKIYEHNSSLTTSAVISSIDSKRISIIITNDNETEAKVNIGLSYAQNEGTCELNLDNSKKLINSVIDNIESLSDKLIKNTSDENNEAGYLTYKNINTPIELTDNMNIYVSDKFTYQNEKFKLTEAKVIESSKISDYQNHYTCLDKDNCRNLYRIIETKKEENKLYTITKYDLLEGYLSGKTGLRKVADDYYYYGDNPHNFIYYNCANEKDVKNCELWRIIGFTFDKENNKYYTKIIKNDYLSPTEYNNTNHTWKDSLIDKYLKEYKINNDYLMKEMTFKPENLTDLNSNISKDGEDIKTKVMLLNLSDYINTSICENKKISEYDTNCLNNNWLDRTVNEWTMTIKTTPSLNAEEPTETEEEIPEEPIVPDNNQVYSVGSRITSLDVSTKLNVRPVVYLTPRTFIISGDGSIDKPYIIK